jgi:FkbM family methyltransferase
VYNLLKPEYLWRPAQILRRLSFKPSQNATLLLPWKCTIDACSTETIGRSIATQGVYDLAITETIMRLTDPGETALDIGANIGYMSLVLAMSTGPAGRVLSFEPNPDVLPRLQVNVNHWKSLGIAPIEVRAVALSDRDGQGHLGFPSGYSQNTGLASLEADGTVPVPLARLDSVGIRRAGIMKVDVEGHELAVFAGGHDLLAKGLVRDILFEEHRPYPAGSHEILLRYGYRIFRVTRSTWRPLLVPPEAPPRQAYLPSNFLATIDPARALRRLRPRGWYALWSRPATNPKLPNH